MDVCLQWSPSKILYKSHICSGREGILIVLLSPKAQRDRERKSVQIKRAPTDKREEHWDTESKLRPQIQTSSKAKYSGPMTDYTEYTSRKGRESTKEGINERGIRLYQTDSYTYQGQRSNRLRSYGGFLVSYGNVILVVLAPSSNTSITFLTKTLLVSYMFIKKMGFGKLKLLGMGNDAAEFLTLGRFLRPQNAFWLFKSYIKYWHRSTVSESDLQIEFYRPMCVIWGP